MIAACCASVWFRLVPPLSTKGKDGAAVSVDGGGSREAVASMTMYSSSSSTSLSIAVQAAALAASRLVQWRQQQERHGGNHRVRRIGAHPRSRNQVKDIYRQLGPTNFRKAHRMKYHSFKKLARKLRDGIIKCSLIKKRRRTRNHSRHATIMNKKNHRYVPNGPITPSVCLACAFRYFAGGSPYDLMSSYCVGYPDVMHSVWYVVDAINAHPEFRMSYPADHEHQRAIAESFRKKSAANFECCAGAVDGILVWIHTPSEEDCVKAGCSEGKFFCGRKHKFGLNCQAVCDSQGKFLEVSIAYPGSTSDCLAFEGMSLYARLHRGLLAPGLCRFGDNAYLNSVFMATPYSAVSGGSSGSKDAYNFYHSQLRINIECAFSMFTHRWAMLRSAIPMQVSLKKTIALVIALAKLYNFCIDEKEAHAPPLRAHDELQTEMQGGIPLETTTTSTGSRELTPRQLLDGGHHFDDIDGPSRRRRIRQYQSDALALQQELPRNFLHSLVAEANLTRPSLSRRRR